MAGSESGLLAIGFASDDSDGDASGTTGTTRAEQQHHQSRVDKTAQSEADFQAVRASYTAKVENGEIWKTIQLPLGPSVPKAEAQEVLHAVEELYFFRRYDEALVFVRRLLGDGSEGSGLAGGLDDENREVLRYYERKCLGKMHRET